MLRLSRAPCGYMLVCSTARGCGSAMSDLGSRILISTGMPSGLRGRPKDSHDLPAALLDVQAHLDIVRRHMSGTCGRARLVVRRAGPQYPNAAAEWRWQFVFPVPDLHEPGYGPPARFHLPSPSANAMTSAVLPRADQAGELSQPSPFFCDAHVGTFTTPVAVMSCWAC